MALVKFFGPPEPPVGVMQQCFANSFYFNFYTSPYTGLLTRLREYSSSTSALVKFGLYDGATLDKLYTAEDGYTHSVGGDYSNFDGIIEWPVTQGQSYGLGTVGNGYGCFRSDDGGGSLGIGMPFGDAMLSSVSGYSTRSDRDSPVQAFGYPVPGITSIDSDNEIDYDQTSVNLVGSNLLDDSGDPILELCNHSDYASATVKVVQTRNSSSDTGINFDVVPGGLSGGTVYAFVTTGRGQLNATGFAVTLNTAGGTSGSGTAVLQELLGAGSGEAAMAGSGAAVLQELLGAGSGEAAMVGSGTAILQELLGTGSGEAVMAGSGAAVLEELLGAGSGEVTLTGTQGRGIAVLQELLGSGSGVAVVTGSGVAVLEELLGLGSGEVTVEGPYGNGNAVLQELLGTGSGEVVITGHGQAVLSELLGSGTGTCGIVFSDFYKLSKKVLELNDEPLFLEG